MLFKKHYPWLDLLRAVAIILVLYRHYAGRGFKMAAGDSLFSDITLWTSSGVELFFALSGFLIGGQIIEGLMKENFSFRDFFIKRFWRIFPPYYVSLLVVSVFFYAGLEDWNVVALPGNATSGQFLEIVFVHLLYIQNYLVDNYLKLPSTYWSLAVEEQFYLTIPFILFLTYKYARKYLLAVIIAIITAQFFYRYSVAYSLRGDVYRFISVFQTPLHMRLDSLLFGVAAAYVFIRFNSKISNNGAVRFSLLALAVVTLAGGAAMEFSSDDPEYFKSTWNLALMSLGFSALTLWAAITPLKLPSPLKLISGYIAKLSYTMYLYHLLLVLPVLSFVYRHIMVIDSGFTYFAGFLIFTAAVIIFSTVFYFMVDRPSMNYRRRIFSEKS